MLLVTRIGEAAITGVHEIIGMHKLGVEIKDDQTHRMAVIWEWVALLLHLTNRRACAFLDEPKREKLLHFVNIPVIKSIVDTFLEGSDGDKSAYADDVVKKLIWPREMEYAECKPDLIAPSDQPQGGTILWEFGERVADAAGGDPRITLLAVPLALETLKKIEMEQILELCH